MPKGLQEIAHHPLFRVFLGIAVLVSIGGMLIFFFEGTVNEQFGAIGDGIWWAIVTMTTVGYGDKVPVSTGGRVIGIMIMFIGVALVSVFTATISSIFITRKIKEGQGLEDIKLTDHLLLCGWNYNGEQILSTLQRTPKSAGPIVLINQLSEEAVADIINHFPKLVIKYVRGDFTKETILERANVKHAKAAIILPDISAGLAAKSDERTILATLSIKSLNSQIRVYPHIIDRENLSHIRKARADDVLVSDSYSGYLLAAHVLDPGIPETVDLLFSENAVFQFRRRAVPVHLRGKKYAELREETDKDHTICIGVGREQEGVNLSDLLSDDYSFLDQFIKQKFEQAGRGITDKNHINIRINPPPDTIIGDKDFLIVISNGE
jgi:voltage-gated potassium channel